MQHILTSVVDKNCRCWKGTNTQSWIPLGCQASDICPLIADHNCARDLILCSYQHDLYGKMTKRRKGTMENPIREVPVDLSAFQTYRPAVQRTGGLLSLTNAVTRHIMEKGTMFDPADQTLSFNKYGIPGNRDMPTCWFYTYAIISADNVSELPRNSHRHKIRATMTGLHSCNTCSRVFKTHWMLKNHVRWDHQPSVQLQFLNGPRLKI